MCVLLVDVVAAIAMQFLRSFFSVEICYLALLLVFFFCLYPFNFKSTSTGRVAFQSHEHLKPANESVSLLYSG